MRSSFLLILGGLLLSIYILKSNNSVEPVSFVRPDPVLPTKVPVNLNYTWKPTSKTYLINRIPPPEGFKRVKLETGSFGEWLRYLPMKPKGTKIKLYSGKNKLFQGLNGGVLDIDVGKSDLQQCADAVIRLRSEYLYSTKQYHRIHYNYTSGFKAEYSKWRSGYKINVSGNKVNYYKKPSAEDKTYSGFRRFLKNVFMYAGTYSLNKELKIRNINQIKAGDVFIIGGFPGHVVMVADICQNSAGEKKVLLVQSYMPAQSIHIVKPNIYSSNVWHSLNELKAKGWKNLEFAYNVSHLKTWGN